MRFIVLAAEAFSMARHYVMVTGSSYPLEPLQIWRSFVPGNGRGLTYFSPSLIPKGVTTWGGFTFEYNRNMKMVALTYRSPVRRAWWGYEYISVRSEALHTVGMVNALGGGGDAHTDSP